MGRPKGGGNRQYTKEEKQRIVSEVMAGKSVLEMARESGIYKSVVQRWVQAFAEQGEAGLSLQLYQTCLCSQLQNPVQFKAEQGF